MAMEEDERSDKGRYGLSIAKIKDERS